MPTIKVIDPKVNIITPLTPERCEEMMTILEYAGKTCYQSPMKDPDKFLTGIIKSGHESVIEHQGITIEFVTNRAVTHEMVRHRLAAYSQESTRYVKYSEGIEYILPIEYTYVPGTETKEFLDTVCRRKNVWKASCQSSTDAYCALLEMGAHKDEARGVLDNSLKTTIVCTYNFRELRHMLKLRCARTAHPHIRQIMIPLLLYLKEKFPVLFSDIPYDEEFYNKYQLYLSTTVEEHFITGKKPVTDEQREETANRLKQIEEDWLNKDANGDHDSVWFMKPMDFSDDIDIPEVDTEHSEFAETEKEDAELKNAILEKCNEKEVPQQTYNVHLIMRPNYRRWYGYNWEPHKLITSCLTKVRITNGKSSDFPKFKMDGWDIHLRTTVTGNMSPVKVIEMAKKEFIHTLIDQHQMDLIPYVDRLGTK